MWVMVKYSTGESDMYGVSKSYMYIFCRYDFAVTQSNIHYTSHITHTIIHHAINTSHFEDPRHPDISHNSGKFPRYFPKPPLPTYPISLLDHSQLPNKLQLRFSRISREMTKKFHHYRPFSHRGRIYVIF